MSKLFGKHRQNNEPKKETVNTWLKLVGTGFDSKACEEFDKIKLEELIRLNRSLMTEKPFKYEHKEGIAASRFESGQNYLRDILIQKLYERR